ncbi:GNAT family N-acetyltransferase [Paenibacillus sp. LMG 31456]|uniref:GNAT family N-acetyltransferase n=1 Tax=Paenibacillus foliorum TaxID=2654974 RepID=A0A972H293_9BACL|nr:GNAT family N-acetyltransferase [Paenibacillus foliorum]NOU97290.1 GNAT family N-acetyltransferase [Paenibacillus foliorum]
MTVSRSAKPDEIERLVALADRTFRKPGQTSMGAAYSMLFSKDNAHNLLIIEEDGIPATLVGLLKSELSIAGCTIPVVSMGAVCTDTAYRGRNFADRLVKRSIDKCAEDGAQLLLISGTRGLYQRNDCLEVGGVRRFTIRSNEDLEGLERAEAVIRPYDEVQDQDRPAIIKLMEAEKAYYKRTEAELDQLIRSAAVASNESAEQHVGLSFTNNGEAIGYIVYVLLIKEGFLTAEILEYAGNDEAVIGLLHEIIDRLSPQQLHIPVMGDRAALSEKLASTGCAFSESMIPGTIRMINFPGLWSSLQPYMMRQLGADRLSELSLVETSNGYKISYKDESLTIGHRGATALLFNGSSLTEQSELKAVLAQLFPLPFPYTENLNFV